MTAALRGLAVFTTGVMYLVLMMGALVTNTGSADGCGASWPLCKGTFMPNWDYHSIIEFGHRAVSGMAGLLVIALAVWAWRARPGNRLVQWLCAVSVAAISVQGALGAMAVIWPQPKTVLALHFGISLISFSAVLLLAVLLFGREGTSATGPALPPTLLPFRRWVWSVTAYAYGVVYLGALVRHLRASLACTGWPLCSGSLLLAPTGPAAANFIHRVGAGLLLVMVLRMALMARQAAPERPELARAAFGTLALVLLQAFVGASMVTGHFNLLTQMLHSATATAMWGTLSYLCLRVTTPN